MPYDLERLQFATFRNSDRASDAVRRAEAYKTDTQRAERLSAHRCPWCFYLRGACFAGQAFTEWTCSGCHEHHTHPDTAAPLLCETCAALYGACVECGADIDLRKRRKLLAHTRPRKR